MHESLTTGAQWYKRWIWKVAAKSLYPGIIAAIGFAYIGIPGDLQQQVRRFLPYRLRDWMLDTWPLSNWTLCFLAVTVICAVWGTVGAHSTTHFVTEEHKKLFNSYNNLKNDHESKAIDCYKLFSNYLYSLFSKLKLGTDDRISLYKLDFEQYSCIGRYSENGVFNEKPRRLYPKNQGCISKAWTLGKIEDGQSPDPLTEWSKYAEYHKKQYGFTEEQLRALRMKSRAFFAVRLQNVQNETIAVLMIESTKSNGLKFGSISRAVSEIERRHLAALIDALGSHIPSLESANSEGF